MATGWCRNILVEPTFWVTTYWDNEPRMTQEYLLVNYRYYWLNPLEIAIPASESAATRLAPTRDPVAGGPHGTTWRLLGRPTALPMTNAMALEERSQSMVVLGPMMPNLKRSRSRSMMSLGWWGVIHLLVTWWLTWWLDDALGWLSDPSSGHVMIHLMSRLMIHLVIHWFSWWFQRLIPTFEAKTTVVIPKSGTRKDIPKTPLFSKETWHFSW